MYFLKINDATYYYYLALGSLIDPSYFDGGVLLISFESSFSERGSSFHQTSP
jgi:hypothetical protein